LLSLVVAVAAPIQPTLVFPEQLVVVVLELFFITQVFLLLLEQVMQPQ
jgi:hypothetical protein